MPDIIPVPFTQSGRPGAWNVYAFSMTVDAVLVFETPYTTARIPFKGNYLVATLGAARTLAFPSGVNLSGVFVLIRAVGFDLTLTTSAGTTIQVIPAGTEAMFVSDGTLAGWSPAVSPQRSQTVSPVLAGTDANDTDYAVNATGEVQYITSLYIVPSVTVAQNDTNYYTIEVLNGADVLATFTTRVTGGIALTAGTPVNMTITGTAPQRRIAAGGALAVKATKSGTGPAYAFYGAIGWQPYRNN